MARKKNQTKSTPRRSSAKKETSSTSPQGPVEPKPSAPRNVKTAGIDIVMRKDAVVAGRNCKRGHRIAEIQLGDGVSLNFLVDAIRNGLAGDNVGL